MGEQIKILFTIPNFETAGSGKVVYDLVKGLDKNIFAPEICCTHARGAYFKEIEKLKVPIHIFDFTAEYRPFLTFPMRVLKISRFFKQHKFHLIHSWHWSSDFSEPLAAKIAGISFIYTKKAMGWGNKAWKIRSALSTKIIAINKDMIVEFFQNMAHKTIYLPLGVDLTYFSPMPIDQTLKEVLKIENNAFVILTVANLVKVKGIEILLEAVNLLNDPNIKVLIVGADHSDYASALKIKYNNAAYQFLGKKEDVRPYLSLADLFVIPTLDEGRKEGLPIAPLEAMAMGKIVLGSNISGINDILINFPELLFPSNNVKALINRILYIQRMNDKELSKLKNQLRIHVEEIFSIEKFLISQSSVYEEIKSK